MGIAKTGQWVLAGKSVDNLAGRFKVAERKATLVQAHFFRERIIAAFKTSGASSGKAWVKNAPSVVASKRSSKPLINTGDLRQSINVVDMKGVIFVGIPSGKRSRDGKRVTQIGEVHEFGKIILIPVTDKMRKYVMMKMRELGYPPSAGRAKFTKGVMILKIPERSFLRSTGQKYFSNRAKVAARYNKSLAKFMGKGWSALAR